MLLHWPHDGLAMESSLDALVSLQERGLVRHIGVSNYRSELLEQAAQHAKLLCTQLEFHVYLHVDPVLAVARKHGIQVAAYCPIARGQVMGDALLQRIGSVHGATAAQVALRWLTLQDGVVAVPKSVTPSRIEENLASLSLTLSEEERSQIDALDTQGRLIDPPFVSWD
jgi:diketogulonate reductase-like aldo/keto reductase